MIASSEQIDAGIKQALQSPAKARLSILRRIRTSLKNRIELFQKEIAAAV